MDKLSYKNRLVGLTEDQARYVGLDCEMVGVAAPSGYIYPEKSILAQVSIVDWNGDVIYQSYVTPTEPVINYRTPWSGITKEVLEANGRPFDIVRAEVLAQITGKIVVGHGLENDFAVLEIDPQTVETRDTGYARPLQKELYDGSYGPRKLKDLVDEYLGKQIQSGEHDPSEDARAAMELFKKLRYDMFETQPFTEANMNAFMRLFSATTLAPTVKNNGTLRRKTRGKQTRGPKERNVRKNQKNQKTRKNRKERK